jgi:hypothetical protein
MGGVHSGSPKNEKEQKLSQLQSLYVFSNLPVALLFVRTIGRLILDALKPLVYDIRNLKKFENSPGISIHLAITLLPLMDKDNYILDIGTEEKINRISLFLDSRDELTLRFYDNSGKRHIVRAGSADCAYKYEEPTYLSIQLGIYNGDLLLGVEAGGWSHYYVMSNTSFGFSPDQLHFVLGSDVKGKAETHIDIMEQCVYSRILKQEEQSQIKDYFENRIAEGYQARVHFEGNQFLHSERHPNFS